MYRLMGWFVSIVTFPGVIIHELGHQFFCNLFGVEVLEVSYFNPFRNPIGYVVHGAPANFGQQYWITVGPLLVNSFICFAGGIAAIAVYGEPAKENYLYGLLAWIAVSTGMHAFPSLGDARSLWAYATDGSSGSILAKLLAFPTVVLILLGSVARFFWLDLAYAYFVAILLPAQLLLSDFDVNVSVNLPAPPSQRSPTATPRPGPPTAFAQPTAFIAPTMPPVPTRTPTPSLSKMWVCAELAFGYSQPDDRSDKVWQMSQNDGWTVYALDQVGQWYEVRSGNTVAYMHSSTLCSKPPVAKQGSEAGAQPDFCSLPPEQQMKLDLSRYILDPCDDPSPTPLAHPFPTKDWLDDLLASVSGTPTAWARPSLPKGMGGVVVDNFCGFEVYFEIAGELHTIPPSETIYVQLPPNHYSVSATAAGQKLVCGGGGCALDVIEGVYTDYPYCSWTE